MRAMDRLLIRRRKLPRAADLTPLVRRRLAPACRALAAAEAEMAEALGLPEPPRLLLVDEEQAVILTPADRDLEPRPGG